MLAFSRRCARDPSLRLGLTVFLAMRVLLSAWAIVALAVNPLPETPDEIVRPYLGEPVLNEGAAGLLLGPWQRFDTQRYMHIARNGYALEENSVFPPLYPVAVRLLGYPMGGGGSANLLAGIVIANLSCLALLVLFHKVVANETDNGTATRSVVYLSIFPTGFFLLAPYTESLFMLCSLGALWSARKGRFWQAGILAALASLTRLTGWVLFVPLAYEHWRQRISEDSEDEGSLTVPGLRRLILKPDVVALAFPIFTLVGFVAWRWASGLPSLGAIYEQYWYQSVGIPGSDILSAANSLFFGGIARNNELIALSLDFASAWLLIITTIVAFRRLVPSYGLYSAPLLLFMLLPLSEVKPLYSFSRYALAFFPTFILLGIAGRRPMINRLILYPSVLLHLYFSGQFFIWGWVA